MGVYTPTMSIDRSLIPYSKTANLAHYSSYAESSLLPTANLMLNYILKPVRHESFHRKYAGKRFLKVSIRDVPPSI